MKVKKNVIQLVEKDSVPSEARLPTIHGDFNIRVFHESSTGFDHVALTLGDSPVLTLS